MTTKTAMTGCVGDTPAPVTIPTGRWLFEIDDCGVSRKSTGTKAWFNLTPVEPADEVDAEEAAEYEGDGGLSEQTVFHSYSEDRAYECVKFLDAIGVNTKEVDWKRLDELAGVKFFALVSHDPNDKDPQRPWVRLRAFEAANGTDEAPF